MPDQNHIREILEYPEREFVEHLSLEYNHRILFSGRFGIGKTTFLKYFFENSKHQEEYNVVHLFPVNYQVSDNKDIFEYTKYDIIARLLSVEEIEFEKNEVSAALTVPYLLMQRPADVLAPLLHFSGGAGKAYEKYQELANEVYEQHEAVQKDDKKALSAYLTEAKNQTGSIYENDFYTQLIVTLLQRWKEVEKLENRDDEAVREKGKKNVLIIDDLDRIDPQHAFRLFNVFAAHFDHHDEQANKFGFDKVVFVCDVQNVRNIFAHNYGSEVDFSGYIDKFFSTKVHQFDNAEAINQIMQELVRRVGFFDGDSYQEAKGRFDLSLVFILTSFVRFGTINLRALFKLRIHKLSHQSKDIEMNNKKIPSECFLVVILLDTLVKLVGTPEFLHDAFEECEKHEKQRSNAPQSGKFKETLVFCQV